MSNTSNQDPSGSSAEVRQGREGQRNWRAEGPNAAVQASLSLLLAAFQEMSAWQMPRREFAFDSFMF